MVCDAVSETVNNVIIRIEVGLEITWWCNNTVSIDSEHMSCVAMLSSWEEKVLLLVLLCENMTWTFAF